MLLPRPSRRQSDRSTRWLQTRRRPLVESLEGRQLLSTFTVTNVNDSGAGSLRQAILSSNATNGTATNTVAFNIGSGGTQTIAPKSALPTITHPVVIDGTTQPGTGTAPRILLDGTHAGSSAVGLTLQANNSTIKGLVIDDFAGDGMLVSGVSGVSVTDDFIGVNASDSAAAPNGEAGIHLDGGASDDDITDDVISGNRTQGVHIDGGSHGDLVASDFLGTDATGTKPLGNGGSGVLIDNSSSGNTIGGNTPAAADVLSANAYDGVHIESGASGNVVEGDFIGTDITGSKPLGNGRVGVEIEGASDANSIGGSTTGGRDVISANTGDGVDIDDSTGNVLTGDLIGTDVNGTEPLGNGGDGVRIQESAAGNLIGGTAAGAGNVLSDNQNQGVEINDGSTNVVEGNLIGTDVTGTKPLGNTWSGVLIANGASNNTIGGTTAAARNIIADNGLNGVHIEQDSDGNVVEGDFIGTDVTGTELLMGNAQDGVLIDADASDNTVGGTVSGAGNVLSGNGWRGVELNTGAEHNLIEGNLIGTDVNGAHALSNGTAADHSGISVIGGANDNTIGGTTAAARNIISANTYDGVHIYTDTSGTVVEGNFIGTDVTGTYALGNGRDGVEIDSGSDSNTIGGSASGDQNIISGNTLNGVRIDAAARNVIAGDEIGANVNGGPLPNGHDGVLILDGAAGNTIGGNTAAAGDLIAYNLANGVELNGAGKGNLVEDDTIDDNGDNPSSTSRGDGVLVDDSPSARVTGCTIESNRGWGILVTRSSNTKLGPNTVLDNGLGNVSG